jgi:2-iminobutanoate/2-iminopropanoate deaminase
MKQVIKSEKAPAVVGPYSQAIKAGNLIFCAGQIGMDPKTNTLAEGVENQTRQALENLKSVLKEAGVDLSNAVKTNVYLADMNDFAAMNEIYGSFFTKPYPARATIGAAKLPKGALVEMDCIAYINQAGCCGGCCQDEE